MERDSMANKINELERRYRASCDDERTRPDDAFVRFSRQRLSQDELRHSVNQSRSRSPWTSSHSVTLTEGISGTSRSPWLPSYPTVDSTVSPLDDAAMKRMSSSWAFNPGPLSMAPPVSSANSMSTSLTDNSRWFDKSGKISQQTSSVSGSIPISSHSNRPYISQQDLVHAMQTWTTFSTSPPSKNEVMPANQIVSPVHRMMDRNVSSPLASRMNGLPQNIRDGYQAGSWNGQFDARNMNSPVRSARKPNESPFKESQESISPYTPSPTSGSRVDSRTSSLSTPSPGGRGDASLSTPSPGGTGRGDASLSTPSPGGTGRSDTKLSSGSPSPSCSSRPELCKSSVVPNVGAINWSSSQDGGTFSPNRAAEHRPQLGLNVHFSSNIDTINGKCGSLGNIGTMSDCSANDNRQNETNGQNELDAKCVGNMDTRNTEGKCSDTSGPGTPSHGSARPTLSFGGLPLNGQPRRRQALTLTCTPQKVPDRSEIDIKYADIIKQSGFLNLDGHKVSTSIDELVQLGELGRGTCGHVVKMMHKGTGLVMAVKQMHRSGSFEDNKRIMMDLDVVLKCDQCEFIVRSIGAFITSTDVWICMELMATCLEKLSKRLAKPLPEPILGKVTVATLNALNYLKEEHGVIHRDVKPSNILLDEKGRIKLCDFGISGRLVDSKAITRSAGCTAYMAPERIDPPDPLKPDYDIRADVWSLGLSLVELATGEFPYQDCHTDFEVLTKVLQSEPPSLPANGSFSMDFSSFVQQCLTKDYRNRPKYPQLLGHNFVKRYNKAQVDVGSWYGMVKKQIEAKEAKNTADHQV